MTFFSLIDKVGVISTVCPCHCYLNDCKAEFDSGENDMVCIDIVSFICE